ncbi:MAG: acetyl-CoA carboxylase biotin carboxylase subunit, partial [Firmicutes bacterium]|nr:acetyl-CoA carboxylase biotin carboxylase subunit [Bacillota bacterium]
NRGEVAIRVLRAAKDLGLSTVAVYSDADKNALHLQYADETFNIGGAPPHLSYLHIPNIINAAVQTGAQAIHPGYGFLAENHRFAEVCKIWGIEFIGPPAQAIEKMGVKAQARAIMAAAGVPIVPGSDGSVTSLAEAKKVAERIGYPILVKASLGGGGRGIQVVERPEDLAEALERSRREAEINFGQGDVYLEKRLMNPRHIEIQVIADKQGHVVTLGERESSLQRRRQKVLEEAPSTAITPELREQMSAVAAHATQAVGYYGAGTFEFLLDETGHFYFMEMNTRIQVEHACTEMVTNRDLVKEQIRVAAGDPLSFTQDMVKMNGWSIECRINAEDPLQGFRPSPGHVRIWREPSGPWVRVDAGVAAGYDIVPFYDSLAAKLIVWGQDRQEAIMRMRRALDEFQIEGIATTIPLHQRILRDEEFVAGRLSIDFLENRLAQMTAELV